MIEQGLEFGSGNSVNGKVQSLEELVEISQRMTITNVHNGKYITKLLDELNAFDVFYVDELEIFDENGECVVDDYTLTKTVELIETNQYSDFGILNIKEITYEYVNPKYVKVHDDIELKFPMYYSLITYDTFDRAGDFRVESLTLIPSDISSEKIINIDVDGFKKNNPKELLEVIRKLMKLSDKCNRERKEFHGSPEHLELLDELDAIKKKYNLT